MDRSTPVSSRSSLYVAVGLVGLVSTVLLASPGVYTAGAGPLQFDAYHAVAYGFFFMIVASLYYRYSADEE